MIKNTIFNQTLVEISLKIFPAIPSIKWKGRLNKTKIKRMKNPYTKASLFPFAGFLFPFVKKETVNGIIGKTHGVNKAIKPPMKPNKRYVQ